jgi:antitoxin MazE
MGQRAPGTQGIRARNWGCRRKAANMEVRDGKLVVEIVKPNRRRRRYTLERLVAGISPENRHRGLEWGPPVGNEVW